MNPAPSRTRPASTMDELCVNALRFLSVDAVQKANSGHPGLPLGAAPMAYVLWTRFLKHNPANPHWFDRDRFVLSAGHGSMLLYSLLHLTGYDLPLGADQAVPPMGQHDARPPGARPDAGRRDDDRPARPGLRQRRRHGDGGGAPGRALQPPRLRDRRSLHLRHRQRRRPDGRRRVGGRLAGRPSEARQADLSVRRQSRHAFRRHRHHLHRGSRARASRPTAGTRQSVDDGNDLDAIDEALRARARRDRAPVADPGAHPPRLRLAAQAGHVRGARLAARRGRSAA